jgi:hypothetical protein
MEAFVSRFYLDSSPSNGALPNRASIKLDCSEKAAPLSFVSGICCIFHAFIIIVNIYFILKYNVFIYSIKVQHYVVAKYRTGRQ